MTESDPIFQQAVALGEAIAGHARTRAFFQAKIAVRGDEAALKLLGDYQQFAERLQSEHAAGRPPGEEDQRRLAELEGGLSSNTTLRDMLRAQADYVELIMQVHRAIETPVRKHEQAGEGA